MASNQTNRFQSVDSSVEEFIDGQEIENTKKKAKHDVALFHEFLVLKEETRQMDWSITANQYSIRWLTCTIVIAGFKSGNTFL